MSTVAETATLVHGFTMADVERAAHIAANQAVRLMPYWDRYDLAWSGVVEHLYSATEAPTRRELINHGLEAVNSETLSHLQQHGMRSSSPREPNQRGAHFDKYWRKVSEVEDFTDKITERLALPQVLGQLTAIEYQVVAALAAHGNQADAIAALGISRAHFQRNLRSARATVTALWVAPETPRGLGPGSQAKGLCRYGHLLDEHGFDSADGRRRCGICRRRQSTAGTRRRRRRLEELGGAVGGAA